MHYIKQYRTVNSNRKIGRRYATALQYNTNKFITINKIITIAELPKRDLKMHYNTICVRPICELSVVTWDSNLFQYHIFDSPL